MATIAAQPSATVWFAAIHAWWCRWHGTHVSTVSRMLKYAATNDPLHLESMNGNGVGRFSTDTSPIRTTVPVAQLTVSLDRASHTSIERSLVADVDCVLTFAESRSA